MEFYKEIQFILQSNISLFTYFFIFFGFCIGSFFNVVILRYPLILESQNAKEVKDWFEEKNIIFPHELLPLLLPFNMAFPASHCSSCKTPLKWYHNIPVVSFILLRAKCGFCGTKISFQYPIVELLAGAILGLCFYNLAPLGLNYFIFYSIVFLILFLLLAIDLKSFLLPDSLNYFLIWFGLFLSINKMNLLNLSVEQSIYGAITGYLILFLIGFLGKLAFRKESMGQGDFKLIAAIGVLIGVPGAIFTIFASPVVGILTYIFLKIFKKGDNMIPYGPSLIVCSLAYLFWGKQILSFLNINF